MANAVVKKKEKAQKPQRPESAANLSLFDRPIASGKAPEEVASGGLSRHMTLGNIVVMLGVLALLVFMAGAVSMRVSLSIVLIALLVLVLAEVRFRRRWEKDMLEQIQKMTEDYERLVRDVARTRNDTASLRKNLSEAAGSVARGEGRPVSMQPVEQRMIKAIAEQLSRLTDVPQEDAPVTVAPEVDLSAVERAVDLGETDDYAIGKKLTEEQVIEIVNSAVKQDRIDLFLQPVVNLPQRKLRFYEMFSRIRIKEEFYLPATRYIEAAMKEDLMPIIDNLLLLRGLQMIRNAGEGDYNRAFFFNITSPTLNDPKFMGDLVEFIAQNRTLAPRLIFELSQKDLSTMKADVLPVLDGLSKLGCRFSMDQVKGLELDFQYLSARHIRFVKMDAALLLEEMKDLEGLRRIKRMKNAFDRNGIDLIVEKIESERNLIELLEVDIDYGQGYLFGKPILYDKR